MRVPPIRKVVSSIEAWLALRAPDTGSERHSPAVTYFAARQAAELPSVEDDLTRGVDDGELKLVYQPKLSLRSRRVVSLEALVRWVHPVHGLIPPGDFIPAIEGTNAIRTLSLWVIKKAIEDQQFLVTRGHDLPVFVNIAAMLLADRSFMERACALVHTGKARIGFEITETSVIRDPHAAIANLKRVADLNIPIAIDDYGAGLSSLAYLKQLPACELKIDKLFITQLTSSHRDPLIVRSTIDLAHALEMEVVAEGVETQTALALLSVMGCDMAQGYYISHPLNLEDTAGFVDRYKDGWHEREEIGSLTRLTAALKRA